MWTIKCGKVDVVNLSGFYIDQENSVVGEEGGVFAKLSAGWWMGGVGGRRSRLHLGNIRPAFAMDEKVDTDEKLDIMAVYHK